MISIPKWWNAQLVEDFNERAAIKEYAGNMSREQAEHEAKQEIENRYRKGNHGN